MIPRVYRAVFLFLLVTLGSARASEVPFLAGHVNDGAGILSSAVVQALETRLSEYEAKTGNQLAILIIPSLDGEPIEAFALRVAETWKLGKKGVDNGAVLVISKNDRKLRIEVGYGLEASMTDAICDFIIRERIVPAFKSGDFDGGITAGVEAMLEAADGKLTEAELPDESSAGMFVLFIVLLVISLIALPISAFAGKIGGWVVFAIVEFFPTLVFLFEPTGWRWAFLGLALAWALAFLKLSHWVRTTPAGKKWLTTANTSRSKGSSGGGTSGGFWTGGWSSGSGSSSGFSSSGFSGGGGSFGGGGSSGSW